MEVIDSISALKSLRNAQSYTHVGFVPTMGALHDAHAELVKQACKACDYVIVSIFVNPLQFDSSADLNAYPSTMKQDLTLLEQLGCHAVFRPSAAELYPQTPTLEFNLGYKHRMMEGKQRPEHFNGVAIVLCKLFHMIKPQTVYFGEKDWQQCLLVDQLITDLSFDITLQTIPTVRNAHGLALSSRNKHLSPKEQQEATLLYQQLDQVKQQLLNAPPGSQLDTAAIQAVCKKNLRKTSLRLEYFEIMDSYTLIPLQHIPLQKQKSISLCLAARLNQVRLIDHLRFTR